MGDWRKKMRWNWPWPGKGGKTQSSTASANRTTTMGGGKALDGIDSILSQQMASLYTEHFLSAEQLADLFPLARIEAGNLLASSGICPEEAALRLAERRRLHRRTIFSPRTLARRLLRPLCGQFLHCFRLLLLLGSLLCLAFWFLPFQQPQNDQLGLALFFFLTFLVTSLVAAVANWRAKRQLCRLTMPTKMDWPTVATFTAIRSGQQVSVRARDILPGELLLLGAGQPVAADLRVLKVLDGPLLAHSPWPISQQCPALELEFTDKVASAKSMDVFQVRNVLFAGSICTGGAALAVAIRTGEQTLLARLSAASKKSAENAQEPKWLPLRRDCLRLIQLGLCLSLGFSLVAFPAAFLFAPDASPSSAFVNVFLLLFLANLPHGLPLGLDVQLWLIGRRLRQNCGGLAFKRPEMADSLGRTSVLMVQHPAVLTANRPVLTDLWLAGNNRTLAAADIIDWTIRQRQEANGGRVESAKLAEKFGDATLALLEAAAHCCRKVGGGQRQFLPFQQPIGVKSQRLLASFRKSVNKGKGSKRKGAKVADCSVPIPRKMPASIGKLCLPPELAQCPSFYAGGDPVDAAFSKFFGQLSQEDGSLKAGKELLQIDDDQEEGSLLSWRTLRLALVRCSATGQCQLLARGAPEQLLADCTTIRGQNGDQVPMTEEHLVQFEQFLRFSALGKRCVAVAVQENYSMEEEEQGEMPTTPSVLASDCSSAPPSSSFDLDADSPTPGEGWCFLGMLALSDQPKANAAENVRALESAGTRLVLIGDEHPALAHAVANRCGLLGQLGGGKGDDPEKPPPSPPLNSLKPSWRHRVRSPFARGQKKRHSVGSSSGYHSTELATGRPSEAGSEKGAHPEEPTQQQLQEWPIDGDSLSLMSGQRLDRLLGGDAGGPLLFSRLDSEQTGHLVKRFQALGHSVTFVGQSGGAQAGQAMEAAADVTIVGADSSSAPNPWLASQPGDAVCADPDLANIAKAIHEARALRHNMASILSFCLSQSPALFLSILMPILFGFPPALSQFQVLATALLAGIPCCLGLAFHQPPPPPPQNHPNASPTKLRPLILHTFLFSGPLLAIGSLLAYLAVFWQAGLGVGDLFNSASTYWLPTSPNMTTTSGLLLPRDQQIAIGGQAAAAWHLTLVAAQQIHVWLCAARGNAIAAGAGSLLAALRTRILWLVVGFNFCCLLALLYLPALLSDSQPPAAQTWLFPVGIGVALFLANMLQALAIRRRNGKGPAEKVVDQK